MKYLHTMVRVTDIDASLDFYCNKLGLTELRRFDNDAGRFTLVFLAAPGDETAQVELTHNWDQAEPYDKGNGWGHLALEVPDVYGACALLASEGIKITRPAGPMKHGTRVIAFIEDPDGYTIELIDSDVG